MYTIIKRDGTKIKVWVEVRALQEADEGLRNRPILPDRFIEEVSSSGCEAVLVTLRIEEPPYNRDIQTGSGVYYVDAFIKAGWTIQPPVVLGAENDFNEPLPAGTPSPLFIEPKSKPAGDIASHIAEWWAWMAPTAKAT